MIKKLITLGLVAVLGVNAYWTYKAVKFGYASQEYFKYLTLKLDCTKDLSEEANHNVFLVTKGRKPEVIGGYHMHIDSCNKYTRYMCWAADSEEELHKCREEAIKKGKLK